MQCSLLHNNEQLFATVAGGVVPLVDTHINISRNLDARYHDKDKKDGFWLQSTWAWDKGAFNKYFIFGSDVWNEVGEGRMTE